MKHVEIKFKHLEIGAYFWLLGVQYIKKDDEKAHRLPTMQTVRIKPDTAVKIVK